MKYLIIILLLVGCQTVHKTTSDTIKKVDSSSLSHKDSSTLSLQSILSDDLQAKGIDVTIDYQKEDSIQVDTVNLNTKTPHVIPRSNIKSIHIHIDSLSNHSVAETKKDSANVKEAVKTAVKTSTEQYSKVVSKTGIPWWVYVGGSIAILIILAILYLKKIIKL